MSSVFLLSHQPKDAQFAPLRICTRIHNLTSNVPLPFDLLASFSVYAQHEVYEGQLLGNQINSQLTWNEESYAAVTESFSGRRTNIQIRFSDGELTLICQIRSGINVAMFSTELRRIATVSPYIHMRSEFMNIEEAYSSQQRDARNIKEKLNSELKEIASLDRQIHDQTHTDILHMKQQFLEIINGCKQRLRKHMRPAMIEEEEEGETVARKILKVDRQPLGHPHHSDMVIESQHHEQFDTLFE